MKKLVIAAALGVSAFCALGRASAAGWSDWRNCGGYCLSDPVAVRWGDGWIDIFSIDGHLQANRPLQYFSSPGGF